MLSFDDVDLQCYEELFRSKEQGRIGLAEQIMECVYSCDSSNRSDLLGNIVLGGGNTMVNGFAERLQMQLEKIAGKETVKVRAPPERKYSSWIGGSIVASLSSTPIPNVSREEYSMNPDSIHEERVEIGLSYIGRSDENPYYKTRDDDLQWIVLNFGYHTILAGYAGDDAPRAVFPAVIGRPTRYPTDNIEEQLSRLRDNKIFGSSTNKDTKEYERLFKLALQGGSAPYGRSRLMLTGEGREGKSALARSLVGKVYKQLESTNLADTSETITVDRMTNVVRWAEGASINEDFKYHVNRSVATQVNASPLVEKPIAKNPVQAAFKRMSTSVQKAFRKNSLVAATTAKVSKPVSSTKPELKSEEAPVPKDKDSQVVVAGGVPAPVTHFLVPSLLRLQKLSMPHVQDRIKLIEEEIHDGATFYIQFRFLPIDIDFRLTEQLKQDRIRCITAEDEHGRAIALELQSMISKLNDEVMHGRLTSEIHLNVAMKGRNVLVELNLAEEAWKKHTKFVRGIHHERVNPISLLGCWIETTADMDARKRDTFQQIERVPLPFPAKYHTFMSHYQKYATDTVGLMTLTLRGLGFQVFRDMDTSEQLVDEVMKQGVTESVVLLLFLSRDVLTRPYVQMEVRTAIQNQTPILLVHEEDRRQAGYMDIDEIKKQTPQDLQGIFTQVESIPIRGRLHESRAFYAEIARRICIEIARI